MKEQQTAAQPLESATQASFLLAPPQVADRLGITTKTLAMWRSTGSSKLRFVRVGRLIRYRLSDVEAFIELSAVGGE